MQLSRMSLLKNPFIFLLAFTFFSCSDKPKADLLVFNATIYTVDSSFSTAEAMVIKDGKILALGNKADLQKEYSCADSLNAEGKFIYPGFIDAHAHFAGYGNSLQRVNLVDTKSWDEVLERTKTFAAANPDGWILGRGWDQNDWEVKEFPTNEKLTELFPDRPVFLTRIDGHAGVANKKALDLAGVRAGDTIKGGKIVTIPNPDKIYTDEKNPAIKLSGVLVDNGMDLVTAKIPNQSADQLRKALQAAQEKCFAMGLTTIDDCGLGYETVDRIKALHETGDLKMRLYVMLSDDKKNFDYIAKTGMIKTDRLTVRAIKVYGDGALGSRGACLLQPYTDRPKESGFLLSSIEHFDSVANWISTQKLQMCTHAIGDSGNRTILKIYAKYLNGKNDLRWRIEHAQVVNKEDFPLFGASNIIPSVQPTHATSDMYWAGDRLGPDRVKGAYAYKQLLNENGWIPLGTDFPVEDISPFKTFFAAVIRKDAKNWPENGYQMENALSREETLRGMTIWAARANFEEHEKGSLEKGKLADFVILDRDLMKAEGLEILQTLVLYTYLNGERVYQKK